MVDDWNAETYRDRARHWRLEADKWPPGTNMMLAWHWPRVTKIL